MSKRTKVYIRYGVEFEEKETAEWVTPVSLPTLHGVGVEQKFVRSDGELITASKLTGQNYWVCDKVVRSR